MPGGTEENHKNLSQNSWSLGQDLNQEPPEYEAGVLTTRPQHLVLQKLRRLVLIAVSKTCHLNEEVRNKYGCTCVSLYCFLHLILLCEED
jgi:hypothetical protein